MRPHLSHSFSLSKPPEADTLGSRAPADPNARVWDFSAFPPRFVERRVLPRSVIQGLLNEPWTATRSQPHSASRTVFCMKSNAAIRPACAPIFDRCGRFDAIGEAVGPRRIRRLQRGKTASTDRNLGFGGLRWKARRRGINGGKPHRCSVIETGRVTVVAERVARALSWFPARCHLRC
jgi:hypothetical protein